MNFEELRAFLAVAETGSLAKAAMKTGMPRSTLRRRVDALEARAGVTLLKRTGNKLAVTPQGELIAHRGERMLVETSALLQTMRSASDEPAGVLRMNLPSGVPPHLVSPVLKTLRKRFPQLRLDLVVTADPVGSLMDAGDLAVHFGAAPTGPFISYELARLPERLLASRRYLERHGTPQSVQELTEHDLLAATGAGEDPTRWPLLDGREFAVEPALMSANSKEPTAATRMNMPTITPKSPTRVTMKAFLPAAA